MPGRLEPTHRRLAWALACLGMLGLWLFASLSSARAAPAAVDPLKRVGAEIDGYLRAGTVPGDKQELFDDYFTKQAVPKFIFSASSDLRDDRDKFHKKFVTAVPGPARQRALELTVKGFKDFLSDAGAAKKFSGDDRLQKWTAAKVNVIYELGDLNETEKVAGANAKPLAAALPILLEIAKPPAKTARERDDACRAAALVALEHQAEDQAASPETRTLIRNVMLPIVEQQKPPAGRTVQLNDYMRARAAEVLGLMRDPGPKNQVVRALDHIVANPAESSKLRCKAAKALGGLEFPAGSNIDFKSLANHIGYAAVDACKLAIERAKLQSLDMRARRRVKTSVRDAMEGMGRESGVPRGLLAGATDSTQNAFVKKVNEKLKKLDDMIEKEADREQMLPAAKLTVAVSDLEGVLAPREAASKLPAAVKPAEEAEALAGPQ